MQLEQDPIHHHKDVLAHTIAVVQKVSPDLVLRLAALLHDVGKPKTRSFEQGRASFHHHEVVGARMARERLTALRYPKEVDRGRHPARLPAPAHPHLRDGLDRQRGAPVRARRRAAARRSSTSSSAATARRATSARRAPSTRRMDELEARIEALARARRS